MEVSRIKEFPVHGLLPKEETQAARFILDNPEWDGRGTVVAILDDGLDPGAPGLSVTSDGKPKVIGLIDCSGAGDVALGKPLKAEETDGDLTLRGLSGRTLKLGKWTVPTGEYRLGLKRSKDLFNKGLHERILKEKRRKFEIEHHQLVTRTNQELADLEQESAKKTGYEKEQSEIRKTDLKTRLEVLNTLLRDYSDPGLNIDCVVFHDGSKWRAAIDTHGDGDLRGAPTLTDFADELQFARWSDESMLNYSVNIYDNGETLSIVTSAGSHGTHVAGITAANYPEDPALNGVAPGAQLIGLRIGNGRLGSMETAQSITRAAFELARLKPDLANMSYGEASSVPNVGRFIELLDNDVINKNGTIFVSAAGNAGPALSTAGTPGGTSTSIIGVGAYVTTEMMAAQYAILDKTNEGPFTWSSRGPTTDGDVGVDIYAPGAAITCVPQFSLQSSQQMNGTSMASPNACGCLALLVGALKASKIPYTPYRIKAAIQNSGQNISDPAHVKLIQVENAWAHLTTTAPKSQSFDVQYHVTVHDGTEGRGVYLRDLDKCIQPQNIPVEVKPRFFNDESDMVNQEKVKMELRLALVSTAKWITAPENVLMGSSGRTFGIRIDPTILRPGYHFAEVQAFDTQNPAAGPVWSVPVTVCKPESALRDAAADNVQYFSWKKLSFAPGQIQRRFLAVPAGANFCELTVRSPNRDAAPARFISHLLQLHPHTRRERYEHVYAFALSRNGSTAAEDQNVYQKLFPVLPSATLEVCLAQFWSSLDPSEVDVEITFHGVSCAVSGCHQSGSSATTGSGGDLAIVNAAGGFARLDLTAGIRREQVSAGISLTTLRRNIRPASHVISALKSRDVLPNSKQLHQVTLAYNFAVSDAESGVDITPTFPTYNSVLYDAWVESFTCIVYDNNKQELSYQDIYPKAVKVKDGTYTVRVQVISSSVEELNKLVGMALVLDQALPKPAALTAYKSLSAAAKEDKSAAFKTQVLQRGERSVAFVPLDGVARPKDAKTGDLLIGKLDVVGGDRKVDGGALYHIGLVVPPEKPKEKDAEAKPEPTADESQQIREAVRDVEIGWIKKLKDDGARTALLARLEADWPTHLPLRVARLEHLGTKAEELDLASLTDRKDADARREAIPGTLISEIDTAAKKILSLVDEPVLRQYLGGEEKSTKLLPASENENSKSARAKAAAEMQVQKNAVVLAHSWLALLATWGGRNDPAATATVLKSLATYIPDPATNNAAYLTAWARYMRAYGLQGEVVKTTTKWLGEQASKISDDSKRKYAIAAVEREREEALRELGWTVWERAEREARLVRHPADFSLF
ncbi:tripeptidyl-peptidase II Tpp2 [Geranomyces michiganensis]|nr:tripeptidyl-peptidase II Tpp2 [Geranomyces michiganensis]